jgi:type II secretory pathway pseudopilin PulG
LVEVLIAASILAVGLSAAAVLSLSMVSQQKAGAKMARALNYQEQAARLYQLGLSTGSITNIMPRPSGSTISFVSEADVLLPGGTNQLVVCRLVYSAGSYMVNSGTEAPITKEVFALRPHLR